MFINQSTIELTQERIPIDDNMLGKHTITLQRPLCAWCLSEQGIAAGEGSHGICAKHADWLLKQWRERNRRRHQC